MTPPSVTQLLETLMLHDAHFTKKEITQISESLHATASGTSVLICKKI